MTIEQSVLDADPMLLGVPNGVIVAARQGAQRIDTLLQAIARPVYRPSDRAQSDAAAGHVELARASLRAPYGPPDRSRSV